MYLLGEAVRKAHAQKKEYKEYRDRSRGLKTEPCNMMTDEIEREKDWQRKEAMSQLKRPSLKGVGKMGCSMPGPGGAQEFTDGG